MCHIWSGSWAADIFIGQAVLLKPRAKPSAPWHVVTTRPGMRLHDRFPKFVCLYRHVCLGGETHVKAVEVSSRFRIAVTRILAQAMAEQSFLP